LGEGRQHLRIDARPEGARRRVDIVVGRDGLTAYRLPAERHSHQRDDGDEEQRAKSRALRGRSLGTGVR
jgi:hypothetical protein